MLGFQYVGGELPISKDLDCLAQVIEDSMDAVSLGISVRPSPVTKGGEMIGRIS